MEEEVRVRCPNRRLSTLLAACRVQRRQYLGVDDQVSSIYFVRLLRPLWALGESLFPPNSLACASESEGMDRLARHPDGAVAH